MEVVEDRVRTSVVALCEDITDEALSGKVQCAVGVTVGSEGCKVRWSQNIGPLEALGQLEVAKSLLVAAIMQGAASAPEGGRE